MHNLCTGLITAVAAGELFKVISSMMTGEFVGKVFGVVVRGYHSNVAFQVEQIGNKNLTIIFYI